ncbi:GNAT family N-acetyltransferase [Lactobacillus sp. S2-2]|uniref:GNAT family N-acetyltransferase n=1 Tax=Lactobacillus sp. S2-2 TaxID=2692917 RepID=UPI001F2D0FBA|nr:GNAT family N-acetyltransferase [Lactobacillus sp. S2-2]
MFKVRKIEEKDNQVMKEIIQKSLKDFDLDQPGTSYYDPQLNNLFDFYNHENRDYFVFVDEDDNALGGSGFDEYDGKVAELQKVFISKEARGHKAAYQLINQVIKAAKEDGYNKLYLETSSRLKAAVHVYEKMGFKKLDGPLKNANHSLMNLFYIKDI